METATETIPGGGIKKVRKGRPSKGESLEIRKRIVNLGKSTKNLPMREIAEEVGVSINTVADILAKYGLNKQEIDDYAKNQVDILQGIQHKIAKSITDDDIKKAGLKDKMIAMGIAVEKQRLISGESTSNLAGIVKVLKVADLPSPTHQDAPNT